MYMHRRAYVVVDVYAGVYVNVNVYVYVHAGVDVYVFSFFHYFLVF